jgi:hypothetical protein
VANNYFARSGGVHLGPEQDWCAGLFFEGLKKDI